MTALYPQAEPPVFLTKNKMVRVWKLHHAPCYQREFVIFSHAGLFLFFSAHETQVPKVGNPNSTVHLRTQTLTISSYSCLIPSKRELYGNILNLTTITCITRLRTSSIVACISNIFVVPPNFVRSPCAFFAIATLSRYQPDCFRHICRLYWRAQSNRARRRWRWWFHACLWARKTYDLSWVFVNTVCFCILRIFCCPNCRFRQIRFTRKFTTSNGQIFEILVRE